MREIFIVYAFVGLMAVTLLASFVYLVGLAELRANFRRRFQNSPQNPH